MRVPPRKFVHVVYRTHRFAQMIDWYQTVFDARVQYQDPALAFLTYDDEHHRFAFANLDVIQPGAKRPAERNPVGVDHVAYTYGSLNELFENYAWLKDKGIKPYWCIHHGVTLSMYYADPDGNQMEFQVDCFATADGANELMHSPRWGVNPIGVEYDPDDFLAKLRNGTPAAELLHRKEDLPVSPIRGAMMAPA
jgi:catechol-2,3-dioxygenase